MAQPGGLGRTERLAQSGIVVGQFRRRRRRPAGSAVASRIGTTLWTARLAARRFLRAPRPPLPVALTRIGARLALNRGAVAQQTVPVKGEVWMGMFERLAHLGIKRFAPDLDVRG